MTKKQMIKKIEMVLNNLSSAKISNHLKAQAILVEIETQGMLPPVKDNQKDYFYHDWENE